MQILFIHQNFPGQFKFLAPALVAGGHKVSALTMRTGQPAVWQGVSLIPYGVSRGTTPNVHPWVSDFETKTIRGEACFRRLVALRDQGLQPDLIIAHPGWGESLFVKDVWPRVRLGIYCEFFYHPQGADVGFDPEFPRRDDADVCRLRLKNLNNLLHFEIADAGISPTRWQASTFPERFRERISVIHDGIDTASLTPDPAVALTLNTKIQLTRADEIITFVNRNLEPYRGYHIFMRALPQLLQRRLRARILIVGGDGVSYGAKPPGKDSWKSIFAREVRAQIPDSAWSRVHFLGNLPYPQFLAVLRVSRVHVYLTYPFVLSWSLLEAMSLGCTILGSDTPPLHEAIIPGETGRLVNFFDHQALTENLCDLLERPSERERLGAAARAFARTHYDLQSVCLPRQLAWVQSLL
jgi:glycosyltransferase involved in cell wall biosynthesis